MLPRCVRRGTQITHLLLLLTLGCDGGTSESAALTLTPLPADVVAGPDTTAVRAFVRVERNGAAADATVYFCDDSPVSAWTASVVGTDAQGLAFADLAIPTTEPDTVTVRAGLRADRCTTLVARIPPP